MDTGPDPRQYSGPISNSIDSPITSPSIISQGSSKKRQASTSGRGVANLTPEQLSKKRANDRDAQRAIRERTKGHVDSLERKIQELTSQQPYQELQHALRQKESVEAENEEIKKRLHSVLGILQPIVGGIGIPGRASHIEGHSRRLQLTTQDPFQIRPMSSAVFHLFQHPTSMLDIQSVHILPFTTTSLVVHQLLLHIRLLRNGL